mgnify:CR=1 FL=1
MSASAGIYGAGRAAAAPSGGQAPPPAQVVSEAARQHHPLQKYGVKKRTDLVTSPPTKAAPTRGPALPKKPQSVEDRLLNLVEAGKAT